MKLNLKPSPFAICFQSHRLINCLRLESYFKDLGFSLKLKQGTQVFVELPIICAVQIIPILNKIMTKVA